MYFTMLLLDNIILSYICKNLISLTTTDCICGFIEILTLLLRPNFYFESYNEDFAIRCRIFVTVYFSLLLACTADTQKEYQVIENMHLKDQ